MNWDHWDEDKQMQADLEEAEMSVGEVVPPPIYFLHGIHTLRKASSFTHVMAKEFSQFGRTNLEELYYGNLTIIGSRWRNASIAEKLFEQIPDGAILVAQSNGATLGWMLDQMGKRLSGAILIQPALDRDKILHRAGWVDVYYNERDCAVSLSRLLLFHPWGPQGRDGPELDSVSENYYTAFDTLATPGMAPAAGHNWWKDSFLRFVWVQQMVERLRAREAAEMYG